MHGPQNVGGWYGVRLLCHCQVNLFRVCRLHIVILGDTSKESRANKNAEYVEKGGKNQPNVEDRPAGKKRGQNPGKFECVGMVRQSKRWRWRNGRRGRGSPIMRNGIAN